MKSYGGLSVCRPARVDRDGIRDTGILGRPGAAVWLRRAGRSFVLISAVDYA
jgi:hypothetical protein